MGRAIIYVLVATILMVCIILSPIKRGSHHSHISINRRFGYRFPIPDFDPLILKLHEIAKEKSLAHEGDHVILDNYSDVVDVDKEANDFDSDGKLNITLRLLVLFPLLDKSPKDDMISFKELQAWNVERAMDRLTYKTTREMQLYDKDGDNAVSFHEYLPQFSDEDIETYDITHGGAGWWMEQFKRADIDNSQTLNLQEFNSFLHPEDSDNEEIQKWLLTEIIERMDDDGDGKLNFSEFKEYVFEVYHGYAQYETNGGITLSEKEKFEELDANNDSFLDVKELFPMLHYLKPGELTYIKAFTNYLINEADDNGDGHLTLEEMINHEYAFYSTVYDDIDDDEYDDDYHDEL